MKPPQSERRNAMSPPTKKQLNKGFHGFADDSAEFLQIERDPWDASASGHGYNARWSDDSGFERGSNHGDSNSHGLRQKLPDERVDYTHDRLSPILDDSQPDAPRLAGGAPMPDVRRARLLSIGTTTGR